MKTKKKLDFPFVTTIIILAISIIHIGISYDATKSSFDKTFHNMISVLLFAMSLSLIFKFIGKKAFLIKDIGGGAILCLLIPAFIFNYKFKYFGSSFDEFQTAFKEKAKFLNSNSTSNGEGIGFSDFFVSSLVAGSLLNISSDIIKKSLKKFLPLVLISLTISALITGILGIMLKPIKGIKDILGCDAGNFANAIFFIFVPISCGGITCGIVPLTQIFSQGNSNYVELYRSHILPSLLVGGITSIMFGGLIKKFFGNSKYSHPEGLIENNENELEKNDKKNELKSKNKDNKKIKIHNLNDSQSITIGLICVFSLYTFSSILKKIILKFFPMLYKFIPPTIVFLVLIIMLIKIIDIFPVYYAECIKKSSEFITNSFSYAILVIVGIGTDINKVIYSITQISFLSTCILCVFATAISAAIIGKKLGYYPVQSSIAAGLCANSIGGAGNIAILEASENPKLLPYAQISTRLGGDFIVILASIFFPIVFSNI
jgi:Na+/citrate or Na+/malate symporter